MKYIIKPMGGNSWFCHCTQCDSECTGDCSSKCTSYCPSDHPCNVCSTQCGCVIM